MINFLHKILLFTHFSVLFTLHQILLPVEMLPPSSRDGFKKLLPSLEMVQHVLNFAFNAVAKKTQFR